MTDLAELPAEVGEALAAMANAPEGEARDQAAEQAATALLGALGYGPDMLGRAEAVALQRQAFAKLREADQVEHVARLAAVIAPAEQARQVAESEAEAAAEVERVSLGGVRDAEDKHREAVEHYRECAQAADDAEVIGDTPAVQTETLLARNAAAEVVERFAAKLDQARQRHARDVERITATRDLVKALRGAEQAARDALTEAEQHPERAGRSVFTLSLGMSESAAAFNALTDDERATLRNLVANLAQSIGADRAARAESRQAGYDRGLADAREEGRLATMGMTQRGGEHVLPPGVGRRR